MKIVKSLFLVLLLGGLLSACSNDETLKEQDPTKQTEAVQKNLEQSTGSDTPDLNQTAPSNTREEQIEALKKLVPEGVSKRPNSIEEFAAFPSGRFSGLSNSDHSEEIDQFIKGLPAIDNPDEEISELYYLAILGLFAEDYPDPQEISDQIKLASFGNPEIKDPRYQYKENYNVEIILDASGSMAEVVDGQTKMDAAKAAIQAFASSLPKNANVALRVYGHKGSGRESDKVLSCGSSELVYTMQPYNQQKLQSSLSQFKPVGYTPIAFSLQEAMKDLSNLPGEKNTNIIYLVSDGIETCDGNPVEAAKQLANSNITPILNVIGFDVDGEGQKQLKEVAAAAKGRYVSITDQNELTAELQRAKQIADEWDKWKRKETQDAYYKSVHQGVDNTRFKLKWRFLADREKFQIKPFIRKLKNDGRFSEQLTDRLNEMLDEQYNLVDQRSKEIEDFLDLLTDKTYKESIEIINQKFHTNVNTNE